jgi:hypothetical protein
LGAWGTGVQTTKAKRCGRKKRTRRIGEERWGEEGAAPAAWAAAVKEGSAGKH